MENPRQKNREEEKRGIDWRFKGIILAALSLWISAAALLKLPCPILHFTSIPCMGCGMTRALSAMLRGEWAQAFEYHRMVWSLPLLLLIFLFDGKLFRKPLMNALLIGGVALGFVLNWALNLKMYITY